MNAWKKIKKAWDEDPIKVTIVAAGALTAIAKVIDAVAGIQSKRTYARNYKRRR